MLGLPFLDKSIIVADATGLAPRLLWLCIFSRQSLFPGPGRAHHGI